MGKIFYVMGKSASGKDTVYKELTRRLPWLRRVRMYTTRPIRDGEQNGVEYFFVGPDFLRRCEAEGRVIECRTYDTVYGPWSYFTAEDGQIRLSDGDYLMMGTLESYQKLKEVYGEDAICPIYIYLADGLRLERALKRESAQKTPRYAELCRRYLADEEDFSEERLKRAGITGGYENVVLEECIQEIINEIMEVGTMKKIGFIGVGIMGKSMVRNLMKAGYQVSIYSRTRSKAEDVIAEGAIWHDSAAQCAKGQDAVITIVGYPKDVEEVYFGENGIIANADPGTYLIDMTTTSPKLAARIAEEAKQAGLHGMDAPVTGGDAGAKAGTLTILVGGERKDFEACLPVFQAMGKNIHYTGKAGNGQHTKMCNQIAIAGALAGACEAMVYAKNMGLNVGETLQAISTGAAGSAQMNNVASKAVEDHYEPGFFMKHFIKDMALADEEAREAGVTLDVLEDVLSICRKLEAEGMGDLGTQALIRHYKW